MEESARVVLKKCEKNIRFKRLTNLPFVSTRRPALCAPVATGKVTDVLFGELVFFSLAPHTKNVTCKNSFNTERTGRLGNIIHINIVKIHSN